MQRLATTTRNRTVTRRDKYATAPGTTSNRPRTTLSTFRLLVHPTNHASRDGLALCHCHAVGGEHYQQCDDDWWYEYSMEPYQNLYVSLPSFRLTKVRI